MKSSLLIGFIFTCIVAALHADTASVTGVAVYQESGYRASGVMVGLYATKNKGGYMGEDTTSETGVFNTTTPNVSQSVDELWVCSDSRSILCDPRSARLSLSKNGIRTGKTDDLHVIRLEGAGTFTSKRASEAIAASVNTAAVRFMAGRFQRRRAQEWFAGTANRILSRTPDARSINGPNQIWKAAVEKFNPKLPTTEMLEGFSVERLDWKPNRTPK